MGQGQGQAHGSFLSMNLHTSLNRNCRNLLKTHMAAECNWQSKLGTKYNVLHKVDLLDSFVESDVIDNDLINAAEEYLMSVLKGKMYPLKRSTITDIINLLRASHQFNHRFYRHIVFEMGI